MAFPGTFGERSGTGLRVAAGLGKLRRRYATRVEVAGAVRGLKSTATIDAPLRGAQIPRGRVQGLSSRSDDMTVAVGFSPRNHSANSCCVA